VKAVMISIQPKWCELIVSGKKTVEVRKTRPKLETPFKCYIYMTKGFASYPVTINGYPYVCHNNGGMQVIGEFVCDQIYKIDAYSDSTFVNGYEAGFFWTGDDSCLTYFEMDGYLKGKDGYGWHISDLVIYDNPKELGEFYTFKKCNSCNGGYKPSACVYDEDCIVPSQITRPPQSWCYVKEMGVEL
jgi:predicted transcriptional regulator